MNTTTNTIKLSFEVDADAAFAGRLLDDIVRHIQALPNTRDMTAKHVSEVNHWDSIVPMVRPTLRRQVAMSTDEDAWYIDLNDDTVSTIPYASSSEEPQFTISEYKRAYLLKHDIGDLHTYQDYFAGRNYHTISGAVEITDDGYINYKLYETDETTHVGFWNKTLEGWIIPPKYYTIINEAFLPRTETD